MTQRRLQAVIPSVAASDGAGVKLRRSLGWAPQVRLDPFLMLDEFYSDDPDDYLAGFPSHPHRGFETVTYMLEGSLVHKDSVGNTGRLNAGDVQWMTAGSGVIHSEMPSADLLENGGRMHGFQVWVNLPGREKMIAPRYQDTAAEAIPVVLNDDGTVSVKVIAGESLGQASVIQTRTPILYLHVKMDADSTFEQPIPHTFNAFAYVIEGLLTSGAESSGPDQLMLFGRDGDLVKFATGNQAAEFLLLAGEPLNEPVARWGPFVMNTDREILQAIEDFNSGRFGRIAH
jgi:redox-sensitive bicupin YhaK (pirin superfamily)